ncbi:alanyl-tRNA editing protein [Candidatus Woesearchaeota archaeon]|nr:alanyl-tRNA editing protein [Candidatus Woesearchaeota archaeon]
MAEALYMADCYLKEFDAKVVSVKDGKFVVLDKTAFYPASGGQAHDTGKLIRKSDNKEFKVVYVGKFSGEISHEIEGEGLQEGDEVHGVIDWERRYKLMRMHTASHVLSGVFQKEAGALITGNQLDTDKSRIDFSLENFDREKIDEYIRKSNDIIEKDLPIKIYKVPREEAEKDPSMVKLAKGLPEGIKELRIVEIETFDRQPDGGTHVKSTKEVGKIVFLKAKNQGANNRRVYFALE